MKGMTSGRELKAIDAMNNEVFADMNDFRSWA